MLSASTFDSPNSVKTPGGICRQGFFASQGRALTLHPLPPPPARVGAAVGMSRPHRSTCGENMMGWGIQRRGLAAAAATAVVSGGDVAAAAAATAEVAVGSQEPNDDEQDYGVLVQTEKPSVASAVTHNDAPFLRAVGFLIPPTKLHGSWRAGPAGRSRSARSPRVQPIL